MSRSWNSEPGKNNRRCDSQLQETTELYLEEFPQESAQKPIMTTFEVAVHAQSVFP